MKNRAWTLAGSALLATVVLGGVGCADENAPATHVKKLSDPIERPAAIKRLNQFFEDTMIRAEQDRSRPEVKTLLDTIVPPLTTLCTETELDDKSRGNVVKLLAGLRDERAEPCYTKVLKEYKPESTDEDVRWVARAVSALKLKGTSAALIDAFTKLKPSGAKAGTMYRDVYDAMLEISDPAWEPQLLGILARPMPAGNDVGPLKDEIFWMTTAAQVLGQIHSSAAITPLTKAVLSPKRANVAATAINALIKIGKPAIEPTVKLLQGQDEALVAFSKAENPSNATAHVSTAALILGSIGRSEAEAPLIAAAAAADDISRTIIARELTKLPSSAAATEAFKAAYEKTPVGLVIPPGAPAKDTLMDAAGSLFDASLVPWIVSTALAAKGDGPEVDSLRGASLTTAMKLMTADQVAVVQKLFDVKTADNSTLGKGFEKEWAQAKALLAECGDKFDCYLAKASAREFQTRDKQFTGIKAASLVGVLGNEAGRSKIVAALTPEVSNAAVRFVLGNAIDRHSPKGDKTTEAGLQAIVDKAEAAKDTDLVQGNAPLKQVIYRLQARAQ